MPELNELLKSAVGLGASDVHLVPGSPPLVRVRGEVAPLPGAGALDGEGVRGLVYAALPEEQRARFEKNQELDCSFALEGVSRFRMNVFVQKDGVAAALRVIPARIPTPAEIGLTPAMAALADLPHGLVLVTGPTGSGKSTTLASLVQQINASSRRHILTVEDPIEYSYRNDKSVVQQREVGQHTASFSEALRRSLRQDPDVILVGELRDLETISLAITAAETGHLCFATLHTQDCAQTVDRMIDVFSPHQQQQIRVQLSMALKGVIAQVLIPKRDGTGRVAAREFMTVTTAIASVIRDGKTHMIYSAIETGAKFGMFSMDQQLALLVRQGAITMEAAVSKARDPEMMRKFVIGGAPTPAITG